MSEASPSIIPRLGSGKRKTAFRFSPERPPPKRVFNLIRPLPQQYVSMTCNYCKTTIRDRAELAVHKRDCERIHTYPLLMRTVYCTFCLQKCSTAYGLSKHISKHHQRYQRFLALDWAQKGKNDRSKELLAFPFRCSECKNGFESAVQLALHFIKSEETGRECHHGVLDLYQLPAFTRQSRNEDRDIVGMYALQKPLGCPYCENNRYTDAYALSTHIRLKHADVVARLCLKLAPIVANQPLKRRYYEPFICSTCESSFPTMTDLANHWERLILSASSCKGDLVLLAGSKLLTAFISLVMPRPDDEEEEDDILNEYDDTNNVARSTRQHDNGEIVEGKDCNQSLDRVPITEIKEEPEDHAYMAMYDHAADDEKPDSSAVDTANMREDSAPKEESDQRSTAGSCKAHQEAPTAEVMEGQAPVESSGRPDLEAPKREHPDLEAPKSEHEADSIWNIIDDAAKQILDDSAISNGRRCKDCGTICVDPTDLEQHRKSIHPTSRPDVSYCKICCTQTFLDPDMKAIHEEECAIRVSVQRRRREFNHAASCPYCRTKFANLFVVAIHLMKEHTSTLKEMRANWRLCQELLPFRCSACFVGFEDLNMLANHWRLRYELKVPCTGSPSVFHYKKTLELYGGQLFEDPTTFASKMEPKLRGVLDTLLQGLLDARGRVHKQADAALIHPVEKCVYCQEVWPSAQMPLHMKHEHPRQYFENAMFKCKTCKAYAFYCSKLYSDHYESCTARRTGEAQPQLVDVATRSIPLPVKLPPGASQALPMIPIETADKDTACAHCDVTLPQTSLFLHMKRFHCIEYYANAPYHCFRCMSVGFYKHSEYVVHSKICNGTIPTELADDNPFTVTIANLRLVISNMPEKPMALFNRNAQERLRMRHGTLATFMTPIACPLCRSHFHPKDSYCATMIEMYNHLQKRHQNREHTSFVCKGCSAHFENPRDLKRHLLLQLSRGFSICFDTPIILPKSHDPSEKRDVRQQSYVPSEPGLIRSRAVASPPIVVGPNAKNEVSELVRNWRAECRLDVINVPVRVPLPPSSRSSAPRGPFNFVMDPPSQRVFSSLNRAPANPRATHARQQQDALTRVDFMSPISNNPRPRPH